MVKWRGSGKLRNLKLRMTKEERNQEMYLKEKIIKREKEIVMKMKEEERRNRDTRIGKGIVKKRFMIKNKRK